MSEIQLSIDDVEGVFCIMPTPATKDADDAQSKSTVHIDETRQGVRKLVEDGVDAIMINGTFGEAATLTDDEWEVFTETVAEAIDGDVPFIAGPTAMGTRRTIQRARFARDVGADGMLLGRPMWSECSPDATVKFYREVTEAVPELGVVVYDNPGAFNGRISVDTWEELAEIPQIVAAKYTGGMGSTYRQAMESVGDKLRFMTNDRDWFTASTYYPSRARACWSASASCGPYPVLLLRDAILDGDVEAAQWLLREILTATRDFHPRQSGLFSMYNIPLEKHRFNAAGYIDAGPVRPPYDPLPEQLQEGAKLTGQRWRELSDRLRNLESIPPQ